MLKRTYNDPMGRIRFFSFENGGCTMVVFSDWAMAVASSLTRHGIAYDTLGYSIGNPFEPGSAAKLRIADDIAPETVAALGIDPARMTPQREQFDFSERVLGNTVFHLPDASKQQLFTIFAAVAINYPMAVEQDYAEALEYRREPEKEPGSARALLFRAAQALHLGFLVGRGDEARHRLPFKGMIDAETFCREELPKLDYVTRAHGGRDENGGAWLEVHYRRGLPSFRERELQARVEAFYEGSYDFPLPSQPARSR